MGKARGTASGTSSAAASRRTGWARRIRIRRLLRGLSLSALLGAGAAAGREPDSPEQLFERGVAALRTGDYPAACPAIERSHAAEPRLGTLLALADCLDKWGKLHAAVLRHEQVITEISRLEPGQREYRAAQLEYARRAAARLWPRVPRLSLVAPGAAEGSASGVELFLDGARLPALAAEVPVDPGTHEIETRAPGRAPWRQTLELTPGEYRRVDLRLGEPTTRLSAAPSSAVLPSRRNPSRAEPQRRPPSTSEAQTASPLWRHVGWGLGGLGVAGAAAGTLAGVLLLDACPNLSCEAGDRRARDLALATDVGFGVAVVGLVSAAIILVQTAPSTDPAAPGHWAASAALGPGSAWLGLNQRW